MNQVEPNRASYVCFNPTFIWWGCKAPPGWRRVEELGEHHRLVNRLQRITVHSVTTHDFQCVHLLITSRTWSLTDRWLVSVIPSIRTDVTRRISGNSCVQNHRPSCWRQRMHAIISHYVDVMMSAITCLRITHASSRHRPQTSSTSLVICIVLTTLRLLRPLLLTSDFFVNMNIWESRGRYTTV